MTAPSGTAHRRRTMSALPYALLVLAGFLLTQVAWIAAVPPFAGADEFDHAFRASGVAHGEWRLTRSTSEGRGLVVTVPGDLVSAATKQCASLSYTGRDNCLAIRKLPGGLVEIDTAAASYNPVFYALPGIASRPFSGAASLYAMRIASAAFCAAGVFVSALAWGSIARQRWGRLAFLASMPPTLLFTTAIPAPNGPEIVAGLALWTSLLALTQPGRSGRREGWLFVLATVATVLLCFLRLLGPLWVLLIVASVALFRGRDRTRRFIRDHPRQVGAAVASAVLAVAGAAAWVVFASGFNPPTADVLALQGNPVNLADAFRVPLWMLQMVGAFPHRNEPAPPIVYPLWLIVVGVLLTLAIMRSRKGARVSIIISTVITLFLPVAISLATIQDRGAIWQGRYLLPFVVGVLLLCGLALDQADALHYERIAIPSILMLVTAQVISVVQVARHELTRPASALDPGWVHPSGLALGLLMALAWVPLAVTAFVPGSPDVQERRPRPASRSDRLPT